jgi:hypothetical protein
VTSPTSPLQPTPSNRPAWITGWLGVLAAIITSAGSGYFVGARTTNSLVAPPAGPLAGPVSISIDKSTGAPRAIKALDDYTGSVKNIQKGQLVWLFNQQLTHRDDPAAAPSAIFATTGPCIVTEERWACYGIGVGGAASYAPGDYRVWAAVVDEKAAFNLVDDLRTHEGEIPNKTEPPNVDAVDNVIVRRQ